MKTTKALTPYATKTIACAQAKGSTATTAKYAAKYLIANFCPSGIIPLDGCPENYRAIFQKSLAENYVAGEKARKSNPEAKRARHDAAFRRNLLVVRAAILRTRNEISRGDYGEKWLPALVKSPVAIA
jgi:hypothetical protein